MFSVYSDEISVIFSTNLKLPFPAERPFPPGLPVVVRPVHPDAERLPRCRRVECTSSIKPSALVSCVKGANLAPGEDQPISRQ